MLPKRGRPGVTFLMSIERELTSEDIYNLSTMDTHSKVAAPALKRLGEVHHRAARLVASGKTLIEVAVAVGRTPQRISDLKVDPAFKELVNYYATQIDEIEITEAQRARVDYADINDLTRAEIIDRLEDPAKRSEVPIDELRRLMTDTGDRTHTPPKTATPTIHAPTKITFNMGTRDIRPKDNDRERDDRNEPPLIEHRERRERDDDG